MRARATAWASGDLATLRSLRHEGQNISCFDAILTSSFGTDLVEQSDLVDIEDQLKQRWRDAAVLVLKNNQVTSAMLPIADLLKPDGVVAFFKDKGYQVKGG